MPDAQPIAVIPPAAPPPAADAKTPEQRAMDLIKIIPDAADEAPEPIAAPEPPAVVVPPVAAPPPAPPEPKLADIERIAQERIEAARARRAARTPQPPPVDVNAEIVKRLEQLSEKLNAPAQPQMPTPASPEGISLARLARETGLPVRTLYQRLTAELSTGKPEPIPLAPPSPESQALAELRKELEAERAARTTLESNLTTAAEEYRKQQEALQVQTQQRELATTLSAYVMQNKEKYPYVARADQADVGRALAIAVEKTKGRLTPDVLVGRMNDKLRADAERYRDLLVPGATTPNPQLPATQPVVTPAAPQRPPARQLPVIPHELRGIRVESASDAARVKAALDLIRMVPDEE
jgi:hypothetical protein